VLTIRFQLIEKYFAPLKFRIKFTLPLESLGDIVQNINQGRFTVKQVRVFAISSFGQTTVIKSRLVQRHLTKLLGKRKKIEQKRLRQIRNENRRQKNEKFAKQSAILRQRIGFWFKNAYERLKTLLKKRKP